VLATPAVLATRPPSMFVFSATLSAPIQGWGRCYRI
jgi:hypothetical protein